MKYLLNAVQKGENFQKILMNSGYSDMLPICSIYET